MLMNQFRFAILGTFLVAVSSLQLLSTRVSSSASRNSRIINQHPQRRDVGNKSMSMFLEGLKNREVSKVEQKSRRTADTTKIGDLNVPSMGIGTISWSSKSCE